jgi:hypothetical protein
MDAALEAGISVEIDKGGSDGEPTRLSQCWSLLINSTLACFILAVVSLFPIFDMVLDVWVFTSFLATRWFISASFTGVVLVLNWRFALLFATLHPKPFRNVVLMMLVPGFIGPLIAAVKGQAGVEGGTCEVELITKNVPPPDNGPEKAGPTDPAAAVSENIGVESVNPALESTPKSVALKSAVKKMKKAADTEEVAAPPVTKRKYGCLSTAKDAFDDPARFFQNLLSAHDKHIETLQKNWQKEKKCTTLLSKWLARAVLELQILFLCVIFGPRVNFKASLALAEEAWKNEDGKATDINEKEDAKKQRQQHSLYNKVLVFVEGVFESLPQFCCQALAFYVSVHRADDQEASDDDYNLFFASATLSLAGVFKAFVIFVWYHKEIIETLGPPRLFRKVTLKGTTAGVRAALFRFQRAVNDENNTVRFGNFDDRCAHKYYCGEEKNIAGSDGHCGPSNGPQCASCLRFQKKMDVNDEGNPVERGVDRHGEGTGSTRLYYCGKQREIPGTDGYCGTHNGNQCQSCVRFQEAREQAAASQVVKAEQLRSTNKGETVSSYTGSDAYYLTVTGKQLQGDVVLNFTLVGDMSLGALQSPKDSRLFEVNSGGFEKIIQAENCTLDENTNTVMRGRLTFPGGRLEEGAEYELEACASGYSRAKCFIYPKQT